MTPLEKFTPGPWTDAGHYTVMTVSDPHTICEVYGTSDEGFREGHANATLIAAAPDMYEAIAHFLGSTHGYRPTACSACGNMEKAIRKARGEK